MSITLIQSDPMNSMNHNLPHFSIIIKQDYSFHLYKQNVIPYYPTHLVYLSQVSSQHKHPIIFQPPYNYSFLNRIINNYYCHVSITTISTIQIYAFSSILKCFLVTILDIHINFLRMFKNVLKNISFLNIQSFHIRSFILGIVHKHSLMFIYVQLYSFMFIFLKLAYFYFEHNHNFIQILVLLFIICFCNN